MTRHALDGLTYGAAWQRAVGQAPALESLPGCAGTDGGEVGHGGIDLTAVSDDSGLTVERESFRQVLTFILLSSLVLGVVAFGLTYAFLWSVAK